MDYQTERLNLRLKTEPVGYQNCRPADPQAHQRFDAKYRSRTIPDIWEKNLLEGEGWLGCVDEAGETVVDGDCKTCLYTGPYLGLMAAGKRVTQQNPDLTEFYFVYLSPPQNPPPNKT